MKLQYAMDTFTVEEALDMVARLKDVVDIFEVGTPVLLRYGLEAVKTIHRRHPDVCLLADGKIIDGGEMEADFCYESGAEIATVMGLANPGTIDGTLRSARKHNKKLFVDMMNVPNLEEKAAEFVAKGADYICVHNATDVLDMNRALAEAKRVAQAVPAEKLVIAGGINPNTIAALKPFRPGLLIVGYAITKAKDPHEMAVTLRQIYQNA